jgi:hypothetical protein
MKTKIITDAWIEKYKPCQSALDWWNKKEKDSLTILNQLIDDKKYNWADWMITRIMHKHEYVAYAIFAAEQVIHIYEKKYPNDDKPRKAIEAAKRYLKNPTIKNKDAAYAAAYAAYAAAYAASAAAYAASAAAYAAAAAAASAAYTASASAAAYAASAAAYTASASASAAAYAASKETMRIKILKYGIELLKGEKK